MKRLLLCILLLQLLNIMGSPVIQAEPAYAKWGRLAMKETAKRYTEPIVDYLHIGHKRINKKISEDKFQLWLHGRWREFGVMVTIRYQTTTHKVQDIQIKETVD